MSSKVTTKPLMPADVGLRRGAHQQRMGAVLAMQLELRLGRPLGRGRDAGEQARDLGDHRDQRAADQLLGRAADQVGGRAVGQRDPALPVEADHAGRDAGDHRLGEAAALVELVVGADQLGALAARAARSCG